MQTMNARGWVLLSALRLMCVSSNDEPNLHSDVCAKRTRSAHLGSSVLLPCIFAANDSDPVIWAHGAKRDLVRLNSEGRIKFVDHRYGRLKAFPNQGSLGNYSIRIDQLQGSDLGLYNCTRGRGCVEVELLAERGAAGGENIVLIYACVGVAVFVLVCIAGYCLMKCMSCCCDRKMENTNNPEDAIPEAASAPPEGTSRGPTGQRQSDRPPPTQGTGGDDPNQLGQSQGAKQGFHRDLFNRLRQASIGRHYYANQIEMMRQQATSAQADNNSGAAAAAGFGKKKKKKNKKNGEIRNPIYNQSAEQLNLQ
ncbi:uncharacterized protein LOC119217072 isoform X2 [Pungitius pungitius]|uniref:uncharacterized protein LOC119217072 isoform X2 n=1 Tax=Pungitius pungitius TaxID=134920 RepID=UPI002E10BCDE